MLGLPSRVGEAKDRRVATSGKKFFPFSLGNALIVITSFDGHNAVRERALIVERESESKKDRDGVREQEKG